MLAGHLQPLLVRADGRVELRRRARHRGRAGRAARPDVTTHRPRARATTLLLYTDGVTERRRGDEQFGVERLRRAGGAAAGRQAAQLLTVVLAALDRFTAEAHDDDIALLALRAEPSA